MGCYVRGDKNSMGCYVRGDKNSMGCLNVGHFGHGHFGLGRFGPDISATDVSATENYKGGHFGQIINFGLGVCMHKCVMHFLLNNLIYFT